MGFAPLANPRMVMVVTLNGTHGNAGLGGPAAGPVFHNVGIEALRLMDIPRDGGDPETLITANTSADDLADADTRPDQANVLSEGEDDAAPGATAASTVAEADSDAVKAPNFSGMTMRAVLAQAAERGLNVVPTGSGVARGQSPPAGAVLREGERIRVKFTR
jgi:cell division protein FtsI (penicillin-binding protein 3)